jgi:hypothetical protein
MRAGSASPCRCLDEKQREVRIARTQPPEVDLHLDVRFSTSPMKIALVGGVHPDESNRDWTVVARNGTPTRVLKAARLYPFTSAGCEAARDGARRLRARLGCHVGWTEFVARVLVEGPWTRPEVVTPVWVIEGLGRPVSIRYYFE